MGTSVSSTGPGPRVPLVPPWVPDPLPPPDDTDEDVDGDQDRQNQAVSEPQRSSPAETTPLSPPGRFGPARTRIGRFARSGSLRDMRLGLGHYVRKGYGGSGSATQRVGGTAHTAGTLYGALLAAATGTASEPGSPFDPAILSGRSADEVMDALVEAVRATDGTQDAEASRSAIRNAMSDLLSRFPSADLLQLSDEHRLFAIEDFIALDVYNRFALDLGKTIQKNSTSALSALSRMKDVKEYIRENISARFRALPTTGERIGARRVTEIARQTMQETFEVFEEYVR